MSDDFLDITPTELEDKLVVKLYQDTDCGGPMENDNAGQLFLANCDYSISDDCHLPEANGYHRSRDNEWHYRFAQRYFDLTGAVAIPVRFSDYGSSGARIHTTDVDNANGMIWSDADEIAKEWNGDKSGARSYLEARIQELNQYLEGDVYGYVIETPDGEHLDSCWGFYGDAYATDEAHSAARHCAAEIDKKVDDFAAARRWAFTFIRLEYLRAELRAERISYGELAELQSLAASIDPGDVELLEAAGVPENDEYTAQRAAGLTEGMAE